MGACASVKGVVKAIDNGSSKKVPKVWKADWLTFREEWCKYESPSSLHEAMARNFFVFDGWMTVMQQTLESMVESTETLMQDLVELADGLTDAAAQTGDEFIESSSARLLATTRQISCSNILESAISVFRQDVKTRILRPLHEHLVGNIRVKEHLVKRKEMLMPSLNVASSKWRCRGFFGTCASSPYRGSYERR